MTWALCLLNLREEAFFGSKYSIMTMSIVSFGRWNFGRGHYTMISRNLE